MKQSRTRHLVIEIGIALILAVIARVAWDQLYLPSRPVAQVGAQTMSRGQYQGLTEIDLAQQFADVQRDIQRYDEMMSGQDSQSAGVMLFGQDREEALAARTALVEDLKALKSRAIDPSMVDRWIDQEIVLQGAAREGVTVSDHEIAAALLKGLSPVSADDHSHEAEESDAEVQEADPAAAQTMLANVYIELAQTLKQEYGITIGFSQQAFSDYAKRQQRLALLSKRIAERLVPDDQAPISLQAHAHYLLLIVTPTMTETTTLTGTAAPDDPAFAEARLKADQLYKELQSGADFLKLAQEHSANPEELIDPGWLVPDTLWPPLKEAVLAQPLGEVGPPVKTPSGWYLVKVLERVERPDEQKLEASRSQRFQEWADQQRQVLGVTRF